jgi:hypothetical protein
MVRRHTDDLSKRCTGRGCGAADFRHTARQPDWIGRVLPAVGKPRLIVGNGSTNPDADSAVMHDRQSAISLLSIYMAKSPNQGSRYPDNKPQI